MWKKSFTALHLAVISSKKSSVIMAGIVDPSSSTFELRPCDSVSLIASIAIKSFHNFNDNFHKNPSQFQ